MTQTYQSWIDHWALLWNVPKLPKLVQIEFSSRLRRSLGRCYPHDGLIRLNRRLLSGPVELLREVICHEVAHVAAHLLHRGRRRPHGPEWAELMTLAGYEPRARLPLEYLPESIRAGAAPRALYVHSCPTCGASRTARRTVRRWRCRSCLEAGHDGRLDIVTRPARAMARL